MHEVCLFPGQSSPLQFYAPSSVQFFNDPAHQRNYCAVMTTKEFEVVDAEDIFRLSCHSIGTLFQVGTFLKLLLIQFKFNSISDSKCSGQTRGNDDTASDWPSKVCTCISAQSSKHLLRGHFRADMR